MRAHCGLRPCLSQYARAFAVRRSAANPGSHLDSDHVNGVDKLLANSGVKEVALPHLDKVDWVLHLAAGINDGTISGTFVDLASDPAGWFGRRGVERLTYVETDRDDREGGPPQGPLAPIDHRKENL